MQGGIRCPPEADGGGARVGVSVPFPRRLVTKNVIWYIFDADPHPGVVRRNPQVSLEGQPDQPDTPRRKDWYKTVSFPLDPLKQFCTLCCPASRMFFQKDGERGVLPTLFAFWPFDYGLQN
jgi:hypothetical protein